MDFIFPFLNFLQPGVLWPEYAVYRPILIVSVLAAMVGFIKRSTYPRAAAFNHPVFQYLLWFIAAEIISVYYSGVASMLDEFGYWYIYPLFVAISIALMRDPTSLKRYVWGMIVGSMVIVIFGIYAVFNHLPNAVGGRAGAYGMYENHNDYSFIIIMVLPFIYMYWSTQTRGILRLLLLVAMLLCVLGIFLSLSRGGVLALVLELALIVIFTVKKEKRLRYLFFLALLGAAAVTYQFVERAINQGSTYTEEDSETSRFELWRAGENMVKHHPFLGVGSRRFGEFSQEYGEISHDNRGKNAHNTYIEVITTTGLMGFLPFFLMLKGLIRELRHPPDQRHELLEPIRIAALASLYSILFRAFFDAKPHDWSIYILCAIGISYVMLRHRYEEERLRNTVNGTQGEKVIGQSLP